MSITSCGQKFRELAVLQLVKKKLVDRVVVDEVRFVFPKIVNLGCPNIQNLIRQHCLGPNVKILCLKTRQTEEVENTIRDKTSGDLWCVERSPCGDAGSVFRVCRTDMQSKMPLYNSYPETL